MGRSEDRRLGTRDGIRFAVGWLHRRADAMSDPAARVILNAAAFNLGNDLSQGRIAVAAPVAETEGE